MPIEKNIKKQLNKEGGEKQGEGEEIENSEGGIEKNVKEKLNKEGIEKQGEGEAMVFVGTREEIKKARELIETEGRAPDVASYIRLHKEEFLPNSSLKEIAKNMDLDMQDGLAFQKGAYWMSSWSEALPPHNDSLSQENFYYIDKDKNVARVVVDYDKIASLKGMRIQGIQDIQGVRSQREAFRKEIENEHFHPTTIVKIIARIHSEHRKKENEELEEEEKKARESFDF